MVTFETTSRFSRTESVLMSLDTTKTNTFNSIYSVITMWWLRKFRQMDAKIVPHF